MVVFYLSFSAMMPNVHTFIFTNKKILQISYLHFNALPVISTYSCCLCLYITLMIKLHQQAFDFGQLQQTEKYTTSKFRLSTQIKAKLDLAHERRMNKQICLSAKPPGAQRTGLDTKSPQNVCDPMSNMQNNDWCLYLLSVLFVSILNNHHKKF